MREIESKFHVQKAESDAVISVKVSCLDKEMAKELLDSLCFDGLKNFRFEALPPDHNNASSTRIVFAKKTNI